MFLRVHLFIYLFIYLTIHLLKTFSLLLIICIFFRIRYKKVYVLGNYDSCGQYGTYAL